MCYEIANGFANNNNDNMFRLCAFLRQCCYRSQTRGNDLLDFLHNCRQKIYEQHDRKFCFAKRVGQAWNNLPNDVLFTFV